MGKYDGLSRCSKGQHVKFRWFGYPRVPEGQDFQVVLDKFQSIVQASGRITNDYIWAMAQAELINRLRSATAGKLRSPSQIKPIDTSNPPPLYEIRWQGITIQRQTANGRLEDESLLVRMYHSEPAEAPEHFIGHHIHEKDVSDPSQVNARQDEHIKVAIGYFELGISNFWEISGLTNRKKSIN